MEINNNNEYTIEHEDSVQNKSKSIYSDVDSERLELAKNIRTTIAKRKFEEIQKDSGSISNRDISALNELLNGLSTDIHTHAANIVKLQESKANENVAELITAALLKINNNSSINGIAKNDDVELPNNITDEQEKSFKDKELIEGEHHLELKDFIDEVKD